MGKISNNGTGIEISLDIVSNVQHSQNQYNYLLNNYVIKVFDTVTRFYAPNLEYIKNEISESSLNNLVNNTVNGQISHKTKKRVTRSLYSWYRIIKSYNKSEKLLGRPGNKQMVMITLTLSDTQKHDDKYIKRNMLGYFIELLTRHENLKHYFWRAEAQANGNIHFHFITDIYITSKKIQEFWNSIQRQHGYLDKYQSEKGHYNAPSTHVVNIFKDEAQLQYSLKYISKTEDKRPIEGYLFGYSDTLRDIKPPILQMTKELDIICKRLLTLPVIGTIVDEYYTVIYKLPHVIKPREFDKLDDISEVYYEQQIDILY